MEKHSANLLTYALNETGQLVHVDNVPVGNKCSCFCPACKEPLVAKNQGIKRMHHFAHQYGTECNYALETMLHLLAKEKIREAFLSKSEFWIEFEYKSYCAKVNECKYKCGYNGKCFESKKQRFNIKQFYDSCEQEIPYDNVNRRSDLKIFSSINPSKSPLYLEFYVTHASDLEKLHSGNKIIEIGIESMDDILHLVENGIVESKRDYGELEVNSQNISFYGFKNKDYRNIHISSEIEFFRYILYKSGKFYSFPDYCDCKKIVKSTNSSLLEICFHATNSFDLYEKFKYIGFQKFKIPNCELCMNYVERYIGGGKMCRLYRHLQIPLYEDLDTSRAKECNYFVIDKTKMQSVLQNGLQESYTIFD